MNDFPEFASALMAVLRKLETEIVAYKMAQLDLRASYPDQMAAEGFFSVSLGQAHGSPKLRNLMQARYTDFAAFFQTLQGQPASHQLAKVSQFLQEWQSADSKLFPSDSPKKW